MRRYVFGAVAIMAAISAAAGAGQMRTSGVNNLWIAVEICSEHKITTAKPFHFEPTFDHDCRKIYDIFYGDTELNEDVPIGPWDDTKDKALIERGLTKPLEMVSQPVAYAVTRELNRRACQRHPTLHEHPENLPGCAD